MKSVSWILVIIVAFLSLFITSIASAQVRYVHPDGSDAFDGTDWANQGGGAGPWQTLSHALDVLNSADPKDPPPFTEIWIAMGGSGHVYTPPNDPPLVSFEIRQPVAILGGFEGGETDPNQRAPGAVTVLSGDLPESEDWAGQIMRIFVANPAHQVTLDSLKFTGPGWPTEGPLVCNGIDAIGYAWDPETFPTEGPYAPIFIQSCVFENLVSPSSMSFDGGAIRVEQRLLSLRDCVFDANTAKDYIASAGEGGAVWLRFGTLQAARCRFTDNFSGWSGAAIYLWSSEGVFANCEFIGNSNKDSGAFGSGGGGAIYHDPGLYPEPGTQSLTVNNCLFVDNSTGPLGGGAILARSGTVSVRSSTFVGNETVGPGGAIVFGGGGTACEGWGPEDPIQFDIEITNSIFWDNAPGPGLVTGLVSDHYAWYETCVDQELMTIELTAQYNCVEAESVPGGDGNIIDDPLFVDTVNGDYHLRPCSPAINAGNQGLLPDDVLDVDDSLDGFTDPHPWDLDASSRVKQDEVDMGVYERCRGDVNGDGTVDGLNSFP